MSEPLKKYMTAISAALFLFVALSGLAMFFGIGKDLVKEMHEWLAVMFVVAIGLHIVRNWGGMKTYFRRGIIIAPVAVATVAAAAFIVPGALSGRENPMPVLFQSLEKASLDDLGRVLKLPADGIADILEQQGFTVLSTDLSVSQIAADSGRPPRATLMAIVEAKRE
ncbi:DUF4405 domain-containing protein [Methyloceanibacter caenitepidi]|uniref:Flavinylation-associated cytochrome domain-containing protein n=1 Tax=Methyloceanibacter caenitepidi TaxID=1384459 RepID=A0A0A8K1Y3_9HYPH|nr:DUF4405 domain-containing protein [Methyloceanibacter caenitepidi]BAQ16801.1 hypothetical protein GL4_1343 [Methyloceanibacter caenitepidi]